MEWRLIIAILFFMFLAVILWVKRKKIEIQNILPFPILYFALYKGNWGLKTMDKFAKKFGRWINGISIFGMIVGFIGMIFIGYNFVVNLFSQQGGVGIVQPFAQGVPGTFYVPFEYFIIIVFFLAIVHEFSHGVVARARGLKVKSSGFAFLGILLPIIPAAFVEPDEKKLMKSPLKSQLTMMAAGPFANIVAAFLILLLFMGLSYPIGNHVFESKGIEVTGYYEIFDNVTSPVKEANISIGDVILTADGNEINSVSFVEFLNNKTAGDQIILGTSDKNYEVTLKQHPSDPTETYAGIEFTQNQVTKESFSQKYGEKTASFILWFMGLLYWAWVLNLGIGLFNLVPIGPLDGGRMIYAIKEKMKNKKIAKVIWISVNVIFLGLIVLNLVINFI